MTTLHQHQAFQATRSSMLRAREAVSAYSTGLRQTQASMVTLLPPCYYFLPATYAFPAPDRGARATDNRFDLLDTLASSTVQATVFAPTNDAFEYAASACCRISAAYGLHSMRKTMTPLAACCSDFLEDFDLTRSQFINTPAFSRLVLQYHVIPSSALRVGF